MRPLVVKNVKDKATKIEIPFGLSQEECPICWRDPPLHQIAMAPHSSGVTVGNSIFGLKISLNCCVTSCFCSPFSHLYIQRSGSQKLEQSTSKFSDCPVVSIQRLQDFSLTGARQRRLAPHRRVYSQVNSTFRIYSRVCSRVNSKRRIYSRVNSRQFRSQRTGKSLLRLVWIRNLEFISKYFILKLIS
jgi:hypothetical protein